jgi:translation initiation factor 1
MGLFDGTPLERPILCERCGQAPPGCGCPPHEFADLAPETQRLQIRVEKRKRGKVVTLVTGFSYPATQVKQLLRRLKDECGAGGSMDDGQLEIQGDHLTRVHSYLLANGFRVR